VAGCGYWGRNLVRNIAKLGALAAVCDTDAALRAAIAAEFKVPARDWPDVLADPAIAGVVIAAPAVHHARLAREALSAGKHAFVEKPLALDEREADELCRLAHEHRRTLMVGHLLQYHPAFLRLKALVGEGRLGRLQYIYSNRLNLGKVRREENILWSFAPHDISMILSLAGDLPREVMATGVAYLHREIADVTTTHLTFASGLHAHVFVSWLHPFKEQKLVVVGDAGMAVFDDGRAWKEKLLLYPHRVDWKDGQPVPARAEAEPVALDDAEPLLLECRHFLDCIASGERPRTDGEEGARVLRVLRAADRSIQMRRPVRLDETAAAAPVHPGATIHPSAVVDSPAKIGAGTKIWHFSHVLGHCAIGRDCVVGQNVMIGPHVTIGDRCKIQNNVSIYRGVTLEDGVFCGPSMVFTNVLNPRAEVERKDEFLPTVVRRGVTIGANATIVCGTTLGAYAFIAAGAVVTRDVPAHALMAGVPARRIGWVSHAGERLGEDLVCPRTGQRYRTASGQLEEIA
jgi:predicted dehydrogenase/acetyltransferase-like isoleucine patch superfamily enzyme